MRRFFVSPEDFHQDSVTLSGETLHHLAVVLRLAPGDEILLLDGRGTVCRCRIENLAKKEGKASVLERRQETETALPIHLLQALPKSDKMDLILQKGTELGIGLFSPLHTDRSIPLLTKNRERQRLLRWQKIVREAARQSRRNFLPEVSPPGPLNEALAQCSEELRLMLWEEGSRPLAEALPSAPPRSVALLVGPEGGFTAGEAENALRANFIPVRIGPRIMRSETAGFAVAAILQFRYGDLGGHRTRGNDPESDDFPGPDVP
jgi:16S rRNA (uracil1498-N3)-methyltransferase